jgi:hypothetical protein
VESFAFRAGLLPGNRCQLVAGASLSNCSELVAGFRPGNRIATKAFNESDRRPVQPRRYPMPDPSPSELKRILVTHGFEIYRTTQEEVILADRVRDNLLMDSGVAAKVLPALAVRMVLRAEALQFPGERADELLSRARKLAPTPDEYREVSTRVVPIHDPGDHSRTLDTWYEVWMERQVADIDELCRELRRALSIERSAQSGAR